MEGERSIDRLARVILSTAIFTVIALLCWYFRSVLIYIIAAFVVSLVGQPVMRALRRFRIKGRSAPDWLLAVLTLVVVFAGLGLLIAGHIGGVVGMLVAIPAYTVIRVIASRFFYHWKPVRRLIPDREEAAEESGEEAEMGRS